jgi:hypothetical protein
MPKLTKKDGTLKARYHDLPSFDAIKGIEQKAKNDFDKMISIGTAKMIKALKK